MDDTTLTVIQKIAYLRELRAFIEGDTFNAEGKCIWVTRAEQVCDSIEKDLGIKTEDEPKG
ncbi:hypothetical protein [Cohnella luojiensis]|uniref:Uncharacterized protein n=1 Tax=Cohnella luojiensis TaxID=652876 RepID=A0A4Y8M6D4_9BACL|nr:hypothetical protein [Cohnella luojiensis]TFE30824.1 hypothetical protein E2980_03335 [Cohnella luojiensis]